MTIWGTGTPRREFLHVDDLADAAIHVLTHYDEEIHLNVGAGDDIAIRELAALIAEIVGWHGEISLRHVDARRNAAQAARRQPAAIARVGTVDPLRRRDRSTYAWFVENLGRGPRHRRPDLHQTATAGDKRLLVGPAVGDYATLAVARRAARPLPRPRRRSNGSRSPSRPDCCASARSRSLVPLELRKPGIDSEHAARRSSARQHRSKIRVACGSRRLATEADLRSLAVLGRPRRRPGAVADPGPPVPAERTLFDGRLATHAHRRQLVRRARLMHCPRAIRALRRRGVGAIRRATEHLSARPRRTWSRPVPRPASARRRHVRWRAHRLQHGDPRRRADGPCAPDIVTFADPIFHFGPSTYAHQFQRALRSGRCPARLHDRHARALCRLAA